MARKSVKRKTILDNLLNAEGVIRDLTANYHASSITHEDIFVNNSEFSNRCAKIFHESDMITMSDTSADSIPLPIWDLEPTIDVSLLVAPPKNIRCVRFGFVEVIELCMTFGDHIECTHGPAVCLSSTVVNRESFGITEFQYRKENKSRRELHLSASDRRRIIRNDILHNKRWETMLHYELQDEGKARTCKISPCRQEQQSTPTKTSSNESVNSASVVIDVTPKQERHRNRISARLPPREELFMETKYTTSSATALPFYYNLRLAVANEMPMSSFHRHIPICPALTVAERQAKIAAHTNLLHQEIQASDKRFHDLLARISELDKKTCDRRKAMQEKRRCCISCLNNSSHQIIPSPKENP